MAKELIFETGLASHLNFVKGLHLSELFVV